MYQVFVALALVATVVGAPTVQSARMLEQAGIMQGAFDEYRLVLQRSPGDLLAYDGMRRMAVLAGRYDSLVEISRHMSRERPSEFMYRLGLVEGLLGLGRAGDALVEAKRIEEAWPRRGAELAGVLAEGGQPEEAIAYYLRARSSAGDSAAFSDHLLGLYERTHQPIRASGEIVRIVNRDRSRLHAMLPRLASLVNTRAVGGLLTTMKGIRVDGDRARAEAEVLLSAGQPEAAARTMIAATGRDGLLRFGHECEAADRLAAALTVYEQIDARPDRARVLRKLGRVEEAVASLHGVQDPAARFELGDLYLRALRDYESAARVFADVLRSQPSNEAALCRLAEAEMLLGRFDTAVERLARLANPGDSSLLLLTKLQLFRGMPDSVRHTAMVLTARYPSSPLANDALELVFMADTASRGRALAAAIHEYDRGDYVRAIDRARTAFDGGDVIAEAAYLVAAEAAAREGKPLLALEFLQAYERAYGAGRLRPKAMMQKSNVYREQLRDNTRSQAVLRDLVVSFPASPYAAVARAMLGTDAPPIGGGAVR